MAVKALRARGCSMTSVNRTLGRRDMLVSCGKFTRSTNAHKPTATMEKVWLAASRGSSTIASTGRSHRQNVARRTAFHPSW